MRVILISLLLLSSTAFASKVCKINESCPQVIDVSVFQQGNPITLTINNTSNGGGTFEYTVWYREGNAPWSFVKSNRIVTKETQINGMDAVKIVPLDLNNGPQIYISYGQFSHGGGHAQVEFSAQQTLENSEKSVFAGAFVGGMTPLSIATNSFWINLNHQ